MTEAQATAMLYEQLKSPQGFVAKLRKGEGLDRAGAHTVRDALGSLALLWAERTDVPKATLLPLVDVLTPIRESAHLYPDIEDEIMRLGMELAMLVEGIVYDLPRMSEEVAAALVYGHFSGLSSVAQLLHHHEQLYDGWAEELAIAIDTLSNAWSGLATVPKAIAGSMLGVRELVRGHASAYPKQQHQLEAIADDLTERVRRCLG
jgi:hypothetical protein